MHRLFASKRSSLLRCSSRRHCCCIRLSSWTLTAEHSRQQASKQQLCHVHFSQVIQRSKLTTSNHLLTVVTLCVYIDAHTIFTEARAQLWRKQWKYSQLSYPHATAETRIGWKPHPGLWFKWPWFQCSKSMVACGQNSKTRNITSRLHNQPGWCGQLLSV